MEIQAPYGCCKGAPELDWAKEKEQNRTALKSRLSARFRRLSLLALTKNRDYAQGGSEFGNFTRRAILLAQYPNLRQLLPTPIVLAVLDALKHIDCILHGLGSPLGHTESLEARAEDVSVYFAIIAELLSQPKSQEGTEDAPDQK